MLTGKRPRPRVMKRTTSMIEFEFEADADADPMDVVEAPHPSDQQPHPAAYAPYAVVSGQQEVDWMAAYGQQQSHWMMAAAAAGAHMAVGGGGVMYPRNNHRRNSGDFSAIEIAPFLKACGLCKRELLKKDIYMYRGEVAFCSLECRDMQIKTEERKERRALAKIKTETPAASTGSDASAAAGGSGRTVAYV